MGTVSVRPSSWICLPVVSTTTLHPSSHLTLLVITDTVHVQSNSVDIHFNNSLRGILLCDGGGGLSGHETDTKRERTVLSVVTNTPVVVVVVVKSRNKVKVHLKGLFYP